MLTFNPKPDLNNVGIVWNVRNGVAGKGGMYVGFLTHIAVDTWVSASDDGRGGRGGMALSSLQFHHRWCPTLI
jgi:hypothetical protein